MDASYDVHDDKKSHTGGAMSLGCGAFGAKSTKQKLNTESSTESEVVGVSDYGYLFPTFSKMVWFAPYKQIGIVFILNTTTNNNNNK